MSQSVAARSAATPRESLADVRATENKKAARPPTPPPAQAQEPASPLREVARDAIRRVGKQSAAATDIGIHQGRLTHKLTDGTIQLAELEKLGPLYAAEFGRQLLERFGPVATPHARAKTLMRELRRMHDELAQLIDYLGERKT